MRFNFDFLEEDDEEEKEPEEGTKKPEEGDDPDFDESDEED